MKPFFRMLKSVFLSLWGDPRRLLRRWRGIPAYFRDGIRYMRMNRNTRFPIQWKELFPVLHERYEPAGTANTQYFFQDVWASQWLYKKGCRELVDVGSRVDGFVANCLPFAHVKVVDIRPLPVQIPHFQFVQGSILDLPFETDSLEYLSCLHVIEHIGLGRYDDPIDPDGHEKAAKELQRVVKPGGYLLLSTPVGKERVNFNAHRVFHPQTILDIFPAMQLEGFHLIDDSCEGVAENTSIETAAACTYGCGIFVLRKP